MSLLEAVRIAWAALMTNRVRALLTMLGIIIGVSAVIGMLAIGNGLSDYLEAEFQKLGVGVFFITPNVDSAAADEKLTPQLTVADARALAQPGAAPAVSSVVVEYSGSGVMSAGGERYFYTVNGVTPNYFSIVDNTLIAGRYYTEQEEQQGDRVVVLGKDVARILFNTPQDAVGRRMTINGISFDVIGVLNVPTSQASESFESPSEAAYVPYQAARSRLFRNQLSTRVDVGQLRVQARSRDEIDPAIEQVTKLLRQRHRLASYQPNDFTINNPEQAAAQAKTSILGFNAFLGTIAGISLLVGGIGIMNIMLVSVTQRTREIGLRKAVGARQWDILQQFLVEAVVLCLVGCAIGIALGYLMSFAGTYVLQNIFRAGDSRASVTIGSILLATAVSTAVGLGFGFFPALRAARLPPIQALRAE